MNKDAILATVIGLGIGLVLTGIILIGPSIAKSIPTISLPKFSAISWKLPNFSFPSWGKKETITPTPTVSLTATEEFTIDSPIADAIESGNTLLVSGKTKKQSIVVIQNTIEDITVTANDEGMYAGKITLSEGKNDILVTSYTEGIPTQKTVTIYYTPEQW